MVPTEDGKLIDESPAFVRSVKEIIHDLSTEAGDKLSNIGLSAPGLAQKNGRAIGYMPGRLEGIEGLDWTSLIDSDHVVHVINDAQAALMGEVWQGAAKCLGDVDNDDSGNWSRRSSDVRWKTLERGNWKSWSFGTHVYQL